jgi:hypothetical protein
MIRSNDILALANREFVGRQLFSAFAGGTRSSRRESFWRSWGLPRPE